MTTAKVTKAEPAEKPVEAPPVEVLMGVIPDGALRDNAIAIAPPGWTPEQVLRALGYTA